MVEGETRYDELEDVSELVARERREDEMNGAWMIPTCMHPSIHDMTADSVMHAG